MITSTAKLSSTSRLPLSRARAASSDGKSIFDHLEDPKATGTLPSLKSVLSELQTLTQKSSTRLEEVTKLVQVDQGMSLRVLRMANSVYYAPSEPIMDVQDAILYIGLSTFRGAVASTRCIEKTCHIEQSVLDWKEFWTHAAGVGQITMELSRHLLHPGMAEESFYLMGLLHDIGKVVLAHVMPDDFNQIYMQAALERKSPAALEVARLGVDHGQLGAWYLDKQGISVQLCEPVRFHHAPVIENQPHSNHAVLIRLADMLARRFELGQSGNCEDVNDPFKSTEWATFLAQVHELNAHGDKLQMEITKKIGGISDLVRKIIV